MFLPNRSSRDPRIQNAEANFAILEGRVTEERHGLDCNQNGKRKTQDIQCSTRNGKRTQNDGI